MNGRLYSLARGTIQPSPPLKPLSDFTISIYNTSLPLQPHTIYSAYPPLPPPPLIPLLSLISLKALKLISAAEPLKLTF